MHNTRQWHAALTKELNSKAGLGSMAAAEVLEFELGLFLAEQVLSAPSVNDVWGLLTGYDYGELTTLTDTQRRMLAAGRIWLAHFHSPFPWEQAQERYRKIQNPLRGYDIHPDASFSRRPVSLAASRFDVFANTLQAAPPHKKRQTQWAPAGRYTFKTDKGLESITIPDELIFPTPKARAVQPRDENPRQEFTWQELVDTARWIDEVIGKSAEDKTPTWYERLTGSRLLIGDELHFEGIMNVVGMVSAGKTTLLTVLTVCAVHRGLRVAVVFGDVVSVINQVQLLQKLGIEALPILGRGSRAKHINRLHRAIAVDSGDYSLVQPHGGFDFLSSACAIDALRDSSRPLLVSEYPCTNLKSENGETYTCSVLPVCPMHHVQQSITDAAVWVATPQSLLYTQVTAAFYPESVAFGEWLYHHANLMLIDESDRVQVTLDQEFSPNQTLIGKSHSDSWLSRLETHVDERLNSHGRVQLKDGEIAAWVNAVKTAVTTVNQAFYALLQDESPLEERERTYFTAWMIFEGLANVVSEQDQTKQHYNELMRLFEAYIADPLGESAESPLVLLSREAITSFNHDAVLEKAISWIQQQCHHLDEKAQSRQAIRLLFAINIAVLSNRIDLISRGWRRAEAIFGLEDNRQITFNRPSQDLLSLVPASPMGNVLAYQYAKSADSQQGDLRFFRCSGVGRWYLLHYHELFSSLGWAGPHTLLLSGTSWAGTSPNYHIQIPVHEVLILDPGQIAAITAASKYEYLPQLDSKGKRISVSGKSGHARFSALQMLVLGLVEKRNAGFGKAGVSTLERIKSDLPDKQERILLVVGSYEETRFVVETIERERPDLRGYVRRLVSDDDPEDQTVFKRAQANTRLSRGMVGRFAASEAWILVAPLMAIERGHNILNDIGKAALGAVFFLVRPHARPDDISYAIHSINAWALQNINAFEEHSLEATAAKFRSDAYREWRRLLHLKMVYTNLRDDDYDAVTWSHLITLWQVIGRLVRGGSPAQVYFCDAAFAGSIDANKGNMLQSMLSLLSPYFDKADSQSTDAIIVQALFQPLYDGLKSLKGI